MSSLFLRVCTVCFCVAFSFQVFANTPIINSGAEWLGNQQQAEGSIYTTLDISTPNQATFEVLSLLSLGQIGSPISNMSIDASAAESFLASQKFITTEQLSQLLMLGILQNNENELLADLLKARQNVDGGFGSFPAFASTPLDTAWALMALSKIRFHSTEAVKARSYLSAIQSAEGSWTLYHQPTIYTSAIAAKALSAYQFYGQTDQQAYQLATTYLMSQKEADGLWGELFITASVLDALFPSLNSTASIEDSITALENQQLDNGSWSNDVFTTSKVLNVLYRVATGQLNPNLGSIRATLLDANNNVPLSNIEVSLTGASTSSVFTDMNGYFEFSNLVPGEYELLVAQNGYRDLQWAAPIGIGENRDLGSLRLLPSNASGNASAIQGKVVDLDTGLPIVGATIKVKGTMLRTVTNSAGEYLILNVPTASSAQVEFTRADYIGMVVSTPIYASSVHLLSPKLKQNNFANQSSSLLGTVSDMAGIAFSTNAAIILGGVNTASMNTDVNGQYVFENLNPGNTTIRVSSSGYHDFVTTVDIQLGQSYQLSPRLIEQSATNSGNETTTKISGILLAPDTQEGILGVMVNFDISGERFSSVTNSFGQFEITVQGGGPGQISIMHSGYQHIIFDFTVQEGFTNNLASITLREGDMAVIFSVLGQVIDSSNNSEIPNPSVLLKTETQTVVLNSDNYGYFNYEGFDEAEATIEVVAEGYVSVAFLLSFTGAINDLGTIRLRPVELLSYQPDLVIGDIDKSQLSQDLNSLDITGSLGFTVTNIGLAPVEHAYNVLAFFDVNYDGLFSSEDTLLGVALFNAPLEINESIEGLVDVVGTLPYRSANISLFVDMNNNIVEADEFNNHASLSDVCRIVPSSTSDFGVALKYHWTEGNNVYGPIMVAQVTDDNNDGLINSLDSPDLIFNSTGGALTYAIDGATGVKHWQTHDGSPSALGSPSIADIDGDGFVEIVTVGLSRRNLIAYNHDGTTLWIKELNLPTMTSPRDNVSIADIDNDGIPELILGRAVFDNHGDLLWEGTADWGGQRDYAFLSIPADIDLDGDLEIIAGSSVYDTDGTVLWDNSSLISGGGFNAIGNFDEDDFPEIVTVGGKIILYEHTGEVIWGPVTLPGGGSGGPPTVADFDGDGEVEIGVATAKNYVVFETDGSIKWTQKTEDQSSNRTGSSVFDFNGDGRAEIVYVDEKHFFVFDGETGNKLVEREHRSRTVLEYPTIADIDNDGQAELIIGGSLGYDNNANYVGIHIFESSGADWLPTRSIWNQHAYHINNINDDGSVPIFEQPSWLSHNSFRLNAFIDRDVLETYDLSLSQLQVSDSGLGQGLTVSVLIANTSQGMSTASTIDFYQGLPDQGGLLLGSVDITPFEGRTSRRISLDGVNGVNDGDLIYGLVNSNALNKECDATNNNQSIFATATVGAVTLALSSLEMLANENLSVTTQVHNTGIFTSDYVLNWSVLDEQGFIVHTFSEQQVESVLAGEIINVSTQWHVGTTLAGNYQLKVQLSDTNNGLLSTTQQSFQISPSDIEGAAAYQSTIYSDKSLYFPFEQVELFSRIQNQSINSILLPALAVVEVFDPSQNIIFSREIALPEIVANASREYFDYLYLLGAPSGIYTARIRVLSVETQEEISVSVSNFEVALAQEAYLSGTVAVDAIQVEQGAAVQCTDTLTSRSTSFAITGNLNKRLLSLSGNTELSNQISALNIGAGSTQSSERTLDTSALPLGLYACALSAEVLNPDGAVSHADLAYATFEIIQPTVLLSGNTSVQTLEVNQGEQQICFHAITNEGVGLAENIPITLKLIDAFSTVLEEQSLASIAAGETVNLSQTIATDHLALGPYVCLLEAHVATETMLLSSAGFTVLQAACPDPSLPATQNTHPSARNLVVNGSFEEFEVKTQSDSKHKHTHGCGHSSHGNGHGYGHGESFEFDWIPGWETDTYDYEVQSSEVENFSFSGKARLALQGNYLTQVYQDIDTRFRDEYELSFNVRGSAFATPLSQGITEVWWDDQLLTQITSEDQTWQHIRLMVQANSNLSRVAFVGASQSTENESVIDDVRLYCVSCKLNNLVENASFENHGILDNGISATFDSIPGWQSVMGQFRVRHETLVSLPAHSNHSSNNGKKKGKGKKSKQPSASSIISAADGHAFVELSNSAIVQWIETVPGNDYLLALQYSPRIDSVYENNINSIEVWWNNTLVDTINDDELSWQTQNYSVATNTNLTELRFSGVGIDDAYGGWIDDIQLTCASSANQNLLVNGSFETHPWLQYIKFGYFNSIEGWSSSESNFELQAFGFGGIQPSDGIINLELDAISNTSIEQSIATEDGEQYRLSFDYSPRVEAYSQYVCQWFVFNCQWQEVLPEDTNDVEVWWNNQLLETLTGDQRAWAHKQYLVNSIGSESILKFVATGRSDGFGGLIDNVQLSEHKAAPRIVSTPSTLAIAEEAFSYQVDVEGNENTYRYVLDSAPEGMSIDSSGIITWDSPIEGVYQVRVRVEDGCGGVSTQWFTLNVQLPLQCQ